MNCFMCLGFLQPAESRYPISDAALAQSLMQKTWTECDERLDREIQRRWPGIFPALRLIEHKNNIDLIVLCGNSAHTLAYGPGQVASSAPPGDTGNTVITGRRDTWFRFLADLRIDDTLAVETIAGRKHLYRAIGTDVVDARRSSLVLDTPESMLSLVTSYPFDAEEPGRSRRYVVTARMLF